MLMINIEEKQYIYNHNIWFQFWEKNFIYAKQEINTPNN